MRRSVLVCFDDKGLGGTSRSAMQSAAVWQLMGCEVYIYAFQGVSPGRIAAFERYGNVCCELESVPWRDLNLINYHHGAFLGKQIENFHSLLAQVLRQKIKPTLLSNNIFAHNDKVLDKWPGERVTTVLGEWARLQYLSTYWPLKPKHKLHVIPNAQDVVFFRRPSQEEKESAKKYFNLVGKKVVTRIGSPLMDKWSESYAEIVLASPGDNYLFVFMGCPPALKEIIGEKPNVMFLEPSADDTFIRNVYWASDFFVVDSKRGESFGNVIVEALLCGVPVIYRARPFRDNTPWEFQRFQGFYYVFAFRGKAWTAKVFDIICKDEKRVCADFSEFSVSGVAEFQERILSGEKVDFYKGINFLEKLCIYSTHNPLMALLKNKKNSLV